MFDWISLHNGVAAILAAILTFGGVLISAIWPTQVKWSRTTKIITTVITTIVILVVCGLVLNHAGVDVLSVFGDSKSAETDSGQPAKGFPWLRIIIALAWAVYFGYMTKSTIEPKEWSIEKDEDGNIIKPARVRWSSVLSCVLLGLFGSLTILGVHLGKLWWFCLAALVFDCLYIVPFLHTYAIFVLQHQVAFWQRGFRFGFPSFFKSGVWQIWNLSRAKIEANFPTQQLPTGDTPLMIKATAKATGDPTSEDETLSSTISLENWVLFWTNWWPWKFIRYSRTDREQIKTIVFNIIEAMETELLLEMPFMIARQLKKYFITNVDLQHAADQAGLGGLCETLIKSDAPESDFLHLASRVFRHNKTQMDLYKRFLELRKRVLVLIGCYIEDIRVKDRNAPPDIEAAINSVTLARLALQKALINVQILGADGNAISARDANSLKGVLTLLKEDDNASLLLAWTEFKRATENRNISINPGGIDLQKILAALVARA
ncbi:MAG: hypothetical protein WC465_00265 [Patescibacteria group bacterium]